jgi:hypothetical protein
MGLRLGLPSLCAYRASKPVDSDLVPKTTAPVLVRSPKDESPVSLHTQRQKNSVGLRHLIMIQTPEVPTDAKFFLGQPFEGC